MAVVQTATDALRSKHSSLLFGGYQPLLSQYDTDTTRKMDLSFKPEETLYGSLLLQMVKATDMKERRQTAIVNIAYAIRVAIIGRFVKSFLEFHRDRSTQKIRVVVLGSGLDVLGLWSLLTFEEMTTNQTLEVVEVDLPEVCEIKGSLLKRVVTDDPMWTVEEPSGKSVIFSASRQQPDRSNQTGTLKLMTGDLNKESSLKHMEALDTSVPTIAVSELVLAYVHNTHALLSWCRRVLCNTSDSAMIAFEPIGVPDTEATANGKEAATTVLEEYQRQYFRGFSDKLCRGETESKSATVLITPLGASVDSVSSLGQRAGFSDTFCATSGRIFSAQRKTGNWDSLIEPSEPFDEHMELNLHLQSYAVMGAFSLPESSTSKDIRQHRLFQRALWPCSMQGLRVFDFAPKRLLCGEDERNLFWLTTLEIQDEEQIRDMFTDAYKPALDSAVEGVKSIRRMIKSALSNDLALTDTANYIQSSKPCMSRIRRWYVEKGGEFYVAVSDDGEVVGGVGMRPCTDEEVSSRKLQPNRSYFEIHRLVVRSEYRGQRIATKILDAAAAKATSLGTAPAALLATTPQILEDANQFYQSRGFELHGRELVGQLTMCTYIRDKLCE